jgi:carboxyl-terminal processing protease
MNKTTLRALLLAWSVLLLAACGGGGGGGSGSSATTQNASPYPAAPASCAVNDQRAWLRDFMNDQYFWFDRQGAPNAAATSMDQYFTSLLYPVVDRYSFTQSTDQFLQFFAEGKRTGYGYALAFADTAQTIVKVRFVEALSPVGLAGLRRGETIVSIDGFTPAQIAAGTLAAVSTPGVLRNFVVKDTVGVQRSFAATSAEFSLSPVSHATVLTAPNGAKVGYLAYQEFITSGATAMGAAINSFRQAGVTEVVLDLRYNGGGSTTQARNLASMLGGSRLNGMTFAQFRFNAKNSANNVTQAFTSSLAALPAAPLENLTRVFVIMSGGTASASELVINSLRPFMPVITIGSTSYGKPFGSQPRDACGTTYSAISLEVANALGSANYANGFPADCAMSDDLTRELGDPAELRIAGALSYVATGICPPFANVPSDNLAQAKRSLAFGGGRTQDRTGTGFGEIAPPLMRVD